jgi:lipopolysaccharide export system protein LptA
MVATSRQAQYFSKEGRLILSGDVDVIDSQGQRIRAERLTYNLDQERILAQPTPGQQVKSRIRLTIPQSSMGDPPNP